MALLTDDLATLEGLETAATIGPWEVDPQVDYFGIDAPYRKVNGRNDNHEVVAASSNDGGGVQFRENADFIVAIRNAAPEIFAHIRELTRDLEAVTRDRDNWKVWHTEGAHLIELQRNGIRQLTRDLEAARAERDETQANLIKENRWYAEYVLVLENALTAIKRERVGLRTVLDNRAHDLAEAKAERDKFFDQLSLILNSDSQAVDWEASLETNETPPRPVRVTGKSKGAIDYVVVEIYGEDTSTGSQFDNPNGEYSASKQGGFIRGRLAVRNKFGLVELRRENEQLTEALHSQSLVLVHVNAENTRLRGLNGELTDNMKGIAECPRRPRCELCARVARKALAAKA